MHAVTADPRPVDDAVHAVEAAVATGASADAVLELLDREAFGIIDREEAHRLVPLAPVLVDYDYTGHPAAALPAGVAVCAVDRGRGRAIIAAARADFEARQDLRGLALAHFVEGLEDLGEGALATAREHWEQARDLFEPNRNAARLTLAHLALGAYGDGRLDRAVALAERVLWSAQQSGDARGEAVACVYLGFFHLYTGRFGRVDVAVRRATHAFERLPPEHRYELPLASLEAGGVAELRGEFERADGCFEAGLAIAREQNNEWYEAIGRCGRAELTAPRDPARAADDATRALSYLDSVGESWWSRWARLALVRAYLHGGELHAGRRAVGDLLDDDLSPLERGRTLIVDAELAERSGNPSRARVAIVEAVDLLHAAGADFWTARAETIAARVDRSRAEFHNRRARRLAGSDAGDPAWARLLRGPGVLDIRILGARRVTVDGVEVRFSTRAELEVIAMLAAAGGSLPTYEIGDRLWPDDEPERVSHRIDTLLSSLRKALLPTTRLRREHSRIALDISPGECDLRFVSATAQRLLASPVEDVDPREAHTVSVALRQPILAGCAAPWVGREEMWLRRTAAMLEQTFGLPDVVA